MFFFVENFAPFGSHLCSYKCLISFIVGEIGFCEVEQSSGVYVEVVVSVDKVVREFASTEDTIRQGDFVVQSELTKFFFFFNKIINSYLYFNCNFS